MQILTEAASSKIVFQKAKHFFDHILKQSILFKSNIKEKGTKLIIINIDRRVFVVVVVVCVVVAFLLLTYFHFFFCVYFIFGVEL